MLFNNLTDSVLFNMFTYYAADYATSHNLTAEDTQYVVQSMRIVTNLIDGFTECIDCRENIIKALRYYDNVNKSINSKTNLMTNFVEKTFGVAHHTYLRGIIDQNLRIIKSERNNHHGELNNRNI